VVEITDERLREIVGTPLSLAPAVCNYVDAWYFATELLAARMRIRSDEEHLPTIGKMAKDLAETEDELDAARAEVAEAKRLEGVRLAQIASLQEIIRNDTTPAGVEVARFRAEVERLRADLREAMELLRAHGHPPNWLNLGEAANWNTCYGKLLKKHKETNQ
jgi:hypothetical protein